jgi:DeoR/GlpR family transcriptional regulator of sugar metabolism
MPSDLRRRAILTKLKDAGEVIIVDLVEEFGTSSMTIRRDLEFLEMEGLARRIRGGAISSLGRSFETPIALRAGTANRVKQNIGRAAADLIHENETVIIDVGTTTLELAKALTRNLKFTAITSSLQIASELSTKPEIRTIVTGGVLRTGEMSMIGSTAENTLSSFNCDTVFLGVGGISADSGLTEFNLEDAQVKQAAIKAARRCVVLADATKLGQVAFASVASADQIDVLITDAEPNNPVVRELEKLGVDVIHVEQNIESEEK